MTLPLAIALLALLSFPVQPSDELVIDQESVVLRHLILPTSEFTPERIEKRFRALLDERDWKNKILKVEAMDKPSVGLIHKGVIDGNYGTWQVLFEDYKSGIPPFAELVAIGNNAAMRIRDNQGGISAKVLRGESPYMVRETAGEPWALVHLSVALTGTAEWNDLAVHLTFFLQTDGPFDEASTLAALKYLQDLTLTREVTVRIRPDPWFIEDSDFPVVSPFLTEVSPPTQEQYMAAPQWTCIWSDGDHSCWGHSGVESE